jgi:hypothetical protein
MSFNDEEISPRDTPTDETRTAYRREDSPIQGRLDPCSAHRLLWNRSKVGAGEESDAILLDYSACEAALACKEARADARFSGVNCSSASTNTSKSVSSASLSSFTVGIACCCARVAMISPRLYMYINFSTYKHKCVIPSTWARPAHSPSMMRWMLWARPVLPSQPMSVAHIFGLPLAASNLAGMPVRKRLRTSSVSTPMTES